VVSFLKVIEEV
jgi:hypothetical protein